MFVKCKFKRRSGSENVVVKRLTNTTIYACLQCRAGGLVFLATLTLGSH